ncbi:MAG: alkaline phosphatase family protein [Acidobacteriia bacterium]|nr:alkaline phosphatase family protein [Terriglobia bacterium]
MDQFRPDYLDAAWGQLGPGGLRRILENGTYFPDCRHLASSYTSTGLATLATGAWPAQHGIVADTWYDLAAGKPVRASEEDLRASTLTAQVVSAGGTRAYVCSADRVEGAIYAGTPAARLYWMDDEGHFDCNETDVSWLGEYNRQKSLDAYHNAPWVAMGSGPEAPPLRTLVYDQGRPQDFLALYKASPVSQGAQFDFVAELIARERLGQTNTFDFLCLISNATALLGYETGARSPLMQQMTLHLDRQLESLLNQLDRAPGVGMYNLVLAGAHGAPPAPTPESRPRLAVNGELLAQAIQGRLALGGNGHIARYLYPFLYLDTDGFAAPELSRRAAGHAALDQPGVAAYFTADGESSVHDGWQRRFRNSFYPRRSGDVMLSYHPEYIEDYGAARGVSYGSLYDYDVQTPLCLYGPQFRRGAMEFPVEAVDLAPTLARAIGVATPSSSVGRVLGEAFASPEEPLAGSLRQIPSNGR